MDSWAIDFNGGNNVAAFNKIRNVGRTLVDGGGICFAGLTAEKPMTGLRAVGNNIEDCGVGYGIIACSQPTNGVLGDVVFADNTLTGKSTGVSRTAISVYPGAGSTTMMTNINITGNLATKWDTFIQGYYLRGGAIANNVGKTFTPGVNAAMPFGAIDSVVIANNVCKEVTGGANTVMKIEGSNNNNRIVDNIGTALTSGFGTPIQLVRAMTSSTTIFPDALHQYIPPTLFRGIRSSSFPTRVTKARVTAARPITQPSWALATPVEACSFPP